MKRNAGVPGNHLLPPNRHARATSLAETYFDDMATLGTHRLGHTHSDPSARTGLPEPECHPDINPASGLPMMDSALDVAGNPFGTNLSDSLHGIGIHHPTDRFDGHGLSGHSIGNDFHSGHDTFGHGSSWLD